MTIIQGNCLEVLKNYPDNHFTTIITDPPYGLSFMGKKWDYDVPSIDIWQECLRVLKPGGIMLCFAGSRTQHRMACNIEDAGFRIKDCLMWLYGRGFPKSLNIGKENKEFEGYGTALKPAYEPILYCQKPNDGTYAENATKWGVAGINIDKSRIGTQEMKITTSDGTYKSSNNSMSGHNTGRITLGTKEGRFPANILLDEEAAQQLDEQSGINASRFFYCAKASSSERNEGCEELELKNGGCYSKGYTQDIAKGIDRNKPVKNHHPTIKPLRLMQYLIELVMPPKDGLLLDPFAGSGTTILACKQLGYNAIGIEKEEEYCKIAEARINSLKPEIEPQMDMFA